ncbi:MAG: TRAP transporter small permease subunit [Burkholderiales bacterium]|nr:TRAP transporter small permease subunit [Burkholderiales bacterium]
MPPADAPESEYGGPVADALDRIGDAAGRAISWLTLACVLVCFAVVVLRYGFSLGYIWLQELYVWLHAIVFTGCAAYALKHDTHVRVDIFYARMSRRGRAWVNLAGASLMILPWMALTAWLVTPWVVDAWVSRESSGMPDGMPALYLLKAMLLVMAILLTLQAMALAARALHTLRGH